MNIAFYGNFHLNAVNGVSVASYALAKELVRSGHHVFFYYQSTKKGSYTDEAGITKRRFLRQNFFKRYFFLPYGLYDFLKENPDKIEIFHLHSSFYPANNLFAHVLSKLGHRYVITPHGGYHQSVLARHNWLKRLFLYLFEKKMLDKAMAVFCIAAKEKNDLINLGYKGIIRVIPNIVSIDYKPTSQSTPTQPNSQKKIVFLGRYDAAHKGLDNLLHIFQRIEAVDSSVQLCLYGHGGDKELLENMAKRLHLQNISIHEKIFGLEKYKIISEATAYIQPSRWEVFGISIFEAALLGTPVILSKQLYMTDFFVNNGLGIALDDDFEKAARQIIDFIGNEALLKHIKSIIRQSVQNDFSPTAIERLMEDTYKELIAMKPKK